MMQSKAIWSFDTYHTLDEVEKAQQEKQEQDAQGQAIDQQLNQLEADILGERMQTEDGK